jgi:2TM domain
LVERVTEATIGGTEAGRGPLSPRVAGPTPVRNRVVRAHAGGEIKEVAKMQTDEIRAKEIRADEGMDELRAEAIEGLKKRRDFLAHLLAYISVNAFLVAIWAVTGAGFFWPVFPIFGWGIGLFFHAWDTFSSPITEERIEREVARLRSERP